MSAAAVQARRGHVAIEAVSAMMPPRANRIRLFFVDITTLMFCAYFSWKSWVLLHEAIVRYRTGSPGAAAVDFLLTDDLRNGAPKHPGRPSGGQPYLPVEEREGMSVLSIGLLYAPPRYS